MSALDMVPQLLVVGELAPAVWVSEALVLLTGHVNESSGRLFRIRFTRFRDSCSVFRLEPALEFGCCVTSLLP